MHITIAVADWAEAAFSSGMLTIGAILLLVGGVLAFAWRRRSPLSATIALVLVAVVSFFLQPWAAFAPPTTADPDEVYSLFWFRIASVVWTLLCIAAIAIQTTVNRHRRLLIHDTNTA